jgi:hypothetical protein
MILQVFDGNFERIWPIEPVIAKFIESPDWKVSANR